MYVFALDVLRSIQIIDKLRTQFFLKILLRT